ncbi:MULTISPECIES: hypothetical protein [Lachnospiraceae]|uniref:hypothetical protein n=1 Tax=Lachnospiraceae TaxID=186803 RepID=UPI000E53B207|nr:MULTISPECIES: hypothetical protein [Lachnospiraceae]RGH82322.1 hypothetical protein DW746_17555 [Blautia sp. AM28-36]RHR99363.1 hypothetical protein DWW13_18270 [Blautia sp. AF14-40]RHT60302.1 hypothetical protein DW743_17530 [Blautia sp. AM28-27]RHT79178.1 hypothetical protein DW731_17385 [Blautia sp. AM28-10]
MFHGFKNKLRLGITIFVAAFTVSFFSGALGIGESFRFFSVWERILSFIFALIGIGILYIIIYYWYGKDTRCPSCHKPFCLKKTGEEIVSKENVSVLINTNTRNKKGEIVGSQEQYVPGERITYRVNKVCKKCGKTCYSTYKRDIPKV